MQFEFDPTQHDPEEERTLLPDGEYVSIITDTEIVDNSKGTGKILKITHQIAEGAYQNRKVWDNLNIVHQNMNAQEIAQRRLTSICIAVGVVTTLKDTTELHNCPMRIKLVTEPAKDGYAAKNKIKSYAPYAAANAQPAAQPQANQQKAAWAR